VVVLLVVLLADLELVEGPAGGEGGWADAAVLVLLRGDDAIDGGDSVLRQDVGGVRLGGRGEQQSDRAGQDTRAQSHASPFSQCYLASTIARISGPVQQPHRVERHADAVLDRRRLPAELALGL